MSATELVLGSLVPIDGLVNGLFVVWLKLLIKGSTHMDGSLASAGLSVISAFLWTW